MRRAPALLLLIATLLAAGCGGEGDTTRPSQPADLNDTPGGHDAPRSSVRDVAMRDIEFQPEHVRVKAGTTIQWTNFDDVEHNVVATEGADFESELFGKGGTYTFTPSDPGATIRYVCTIHPGMDGTITVKG